MSTKNLPDTENSTPSYTVDNLFTRLGVVGQTILWKKTDGIVRVKGKVIDVKAKSYSGHSYFKLKGVNSSLTIKCPSDRISIENDNIIIEGMPILKASYNNSLEIQIEGEPVGKIAPVEYIDEIIEIKKDVYIRLDKLLEKNVLESLMFFGSETGLMDVFSQFSEHRLNPKSQVITVSDKGKILEALESGLTGVSGFVIVRGGADQTLDIWDDAKFVKKILDFNIPFYVALGHTHQIGLVAQYADESFSTPSILGATINDILNMQSYIYQLDSTVERLGNQHEKTIAELTSKHKEQTVKLNENSHSEMKKLKSDSDLKFEALNQENTTKLTELSEKSDRQFRLLAKDNEQKISLITTENKAQIEAIHKSYQDKLEQSEKELRAKAELDLIEFEKRQEVLREDHEKKLSKLRLDKEQELKNNILENKQELEKFHRQKEESIANLTSEKNKLLLKVEGKKSRKPFVEWVVIALMSLLLVSLLLAK